MSRELYKAYLKAVLDDILPTDNSELTSLLRKNPKLCQNVIIDDITFNCSVISAAIENGSFHFTDSILKDNSGYFRDKADPLYFGQVNPGSITMLHSSGINFYYALNTLQFYAEKNMPLPKNKTYYDLLHNDNGVDETTIKIFSDEVLTHYRTHTAVWFMEIAKQIVEIECQLTNTAISSEDKEEFYARLGAYYLRMAYLEDRRECAFNYFLEKSIGYYQLTSENQQIEQLQTLYKHRKKIFEIQEEIRSEQPPRTCEEWQECYKTASKVEYIIEDDIVVQHIESFDSKTNNFYIQTARMINNRLEINEKSENTNFNQEGKMVSNPLYLTSCSSRFSYSNDNKDSFSLSESRSSSSDRETIKSDSSSSSNTKKNR